MPCAFQPTTWLVLLIALLIALMVSGTVAEAARISGTLPDRVQVHVRGHARTTGFCGVDEVALGDTDSEVTVELPTTAVEVASGVAPSGPNTTATKEILKRPAASACPPPLQTSQDTAPAPTINRTVRKWGGGWVEWWLLAILLLQWLLLPILVVAGGSKTGSYKASRKLAFGLLLVITQVGLVHCNNQCDAGYVSWQQDCSQDNMDQQDALMHAACRGAFGSSAIAVSEKLWFERGKYKALGGISSSPPTQLIFTQPLVCFNNEEYSPCIGGYGRNCHSGSMDTLDTCTDYWGHLCGISSRAALCLINGAACMCEAGQYAAPGASECSNCPAGTYQPSSGASECTDCVAGKYAAEGASTCSGSACAAGKYGQERASSSSTAMCVDCPAGTYQPSSGASECSNCPAGTHQPTSGASECTDCVAGKYAPEGASTCSGSACAAGKYGEERATSSSAATCVDCPVGTYSNTTGSTNCTSCFDGWTTLGPGSTFCFPMKDCLPGTWRTTDDGSCIPCEPGSFSAVNNSLGCTPCAAGKHSLVKGSSSCTARCGPGFYSTTKGESTFFSDTCQSCPRNFDGPSGSTSPSNCTCAAGFFGPTGGPCLPCPTGTFKSSVGSASSCTTCPIDGQWSPTRSVSIDDCMVIPAPVVSEVCPKRPVYHFNEPRFRRCQTPWTWETLLEGYKERRIIYKTGDLGRESVPGTFESWVCMQGDPCATDLIDGYFCYVYNEEKDIFEPWGPNNVLRLIVTRETQDEILHLRAEITNLKAVVANLTTRP